MTDNIEFSVDLVKVGEADVRGPEVWWMSHWESWETLFFYVVVVRGGGRTLLINTGISGDTSRLDDLWVTYCGDQRAAMRLEGDVLTSLALMGVQPDDVTDIVLSPLQAYSVSNVPAFKKATIHVLRSGWAAFHAPHALPADHTQLREIAIPRDVLIYLVTDAWPRMRLLADEDEIVPGIKSFFAGVHHPESLALVIPTKSGPVVWTDGFFKLGNYEQRHPVGLTRSLEDSANLQRRVEEVSGTVLPAFDDVLLGRYPGGHVA